MRSVAIVCPKKNLVFGDVARAMCLSFRELGWSAIQIETESEIRASVGCDLIVVLTPLDYPHIRQWVHQNKLVLYQTEILPWVDSYNSPVRRSLFRKWIDLKRLILDYDVVWDYEKINIDYNLVRAFPGKRIGHLPFGYSSIFELDEFVEIKREALFVGCLNERRTKIMRFLYGKKCGQLRTVRNVYGKDVIRLMKASSINLNLHTLDISTFESHRVVQQLFANKCFVMSEPCPSVLEFKDCVHWASAPHRFMPGMIKYYMARPDRMRIIAENAYNHVKAHFTMTQKIEAALKETGI